MIDGVSPSSSGQGLGTKIESSSELRMDFLNLLIAQLSHQDPMSPMDNEAMVQQLATFSQLEQLERVNSNLTEQMGYSQSLNNTMMMGVAGKRVTVVGNNVDVVDGKPSRSLVRVPDAGTIYPRVLDSNGKVVAQLPPQAVKPGFNTVQWDGKDREGNPIADGNYTLEISAVDRNEAFMSSVTFSSGIVDTVQFDNNFILLEVNGRLYSPGDVVEVGVADRDPIVVNVGGSDDTDTEDGDTGGGQDNPYTPPETEDPYTPDPSSMLSGLGHALGSGRSPWEALLRIR